MLNKLLLYRLIVLNVTALAILAWASAQGWVQEVVMKDDSRISFAIIALFVIGMISLLNRAKKVSAILDQVKTGEITQEVDSGKFIAKSAHLSDISQWLVSLGLIGTVIGFAVALVELGNMNLGAGAAALSISGVIQGLRIAVYTTITGSVLGLWFEINLRVFKTAMECAFADYYSTPLAGDVDE